MEAGKAQIFSSAGKNLSAGMGIAQIQVFNLQALMLTLWEYWCVHTEDPLLLPQKKQLQLTTNIENKYILQILACPDQIPPSSTGSGAAIA